MKIRRVKCNNRKRAFQIEAANRRFDFPYSKVAPKPTAADPIVSASVDPELGREAFTYVLRSGREGFVHIEQILDYNEDPTYIRDTMLYKLTIEAQKHI